MALIWWQWAAGIVVTAASSAIAAWWGAEMRIVRLQTQMESQQRELETIRSDVRYAHRRLNELTSHHH